MHYLKLTGLSQKLWQCSQPLFVKLTKTPLVTGLITGLSTEQFQKFTEQDIHYLEESFQPVMKILRQKASDPSHKKLFSDFIVATDIELTQLKKQLNSDWTEPPAQPSGVCERYGAHLLETTSNCSYGVGLAACLPCFLFFPAIALHIEKKVPNLSHHPQGEWIKVYTEEVIRNTFLMEALVNEAVREEEEALAEKVYMISAGFEHSFFEDALEELEAEVSPSYLMKKF